MLGADGSAGACGWRSAAWNWPGGESAPQPAPAGDCGSCCSGGGGRGAASARGPASCTVNARPLAAATHGELRAEAASAWATAHASSVIVEATRAQAKDTFLLKLSELLTKHRSEVS